MQLLIDAEMKIFKGLSTPVIFLQNVVTDLILGIGAHSAFRSFHDYVVSEYKSEPGYITMNRPKLLDALESVGVENPIVCSNVNKIGFRMCGGVSAYEEIISSRRFRPIAMSVLASGALKPREALEYVCKQPNIQSINLQDLNFYAGNVYKAVTIIGKRASQIAGATKAGIALAHFWLDCTTLLESCRYVYRKPKTHSSSLKRKLTSRFGKMQAWREQFLG